MEVNELYKMLREQIACGMGEYDVILLDDHNAEILLGHVDLDKDEKKVLLSEF